MTMFSGLEFWDSFASPRFHVGSMNQDEEKCHLYVHTSLNWNSVFPSHKKVGNKPQESKKHRELCP